MLKNLSKPMQYALIGVLFIAAYVVLSPMLFPKAPQRVSKKPVVSKSPKKSDSLILPEDLKAHFDPLGEPVKNSFKPLIAKTVSAKASGVSALANNVPVEFSGGEPNWVYTGSAEIDGVLQALLENRTTGDNVFLRVGDTWKGISVEEITEDSLVLSSPETGNERTLKLPTEDGPVSGPSGFTPTTLNPPLRGNIGGGGPLTIQPDGTSAQDGTMGMPNGFGNNGNSGGNSRRRGGGGNRRGGGGNSFGQ